MIEFSHCCVWTHIDEVLILQKGFHPNVLKLAYLNYTVVVYKLLPVITEHLPQYNELDDFRANNYGQLRLYYILWQKLLEKKVAIELW